MNFNLRESKQAHRRVGRKEREEENWCNYILISKYKSIKNNAIKCAL